MSLQEVNRIERALGRREVQAVLQELAGVEALAFGVAEDELDTEDVFVGQFVALVFDVAHGGWGLSLVSDAARKTRLLSLVLFDVLAHFLAQRAARLLRLLDGLGWRDLFSDFFRDDFFLFEAELVTEPLTDVLDDLDESLSGREASEPGGARLAQGAKGSESLRRRRCDFRRLVF